MMHDFVILRTIDSYVILKLDKTGYPPYVYKHFAIADNFYAATCIIEALNNSKSPAEKCCDKLK